MNAYIKKTLSPEEKDKIKERLAVLRREYSTAVKTLQRAQRAQKVKSHVKKTIAEQNRKIEEKLSQIKSGTLNEISPDVKNVAASDGLDASFSRVHQDKKMTVTFNLEPEVINLNGNLQDVLSSDATHPDHGSTCLGLVEQRCETELQRHGKNRMKLKSSRRKLKEKESKPLLNNSPVFDSICGKITEKETDCNNRCRDSPVFGKSSNVAAQDSATLAVVRFGESKLGSTSVGSREDVFLEARRCSTMEQAAVDSELGCFSSSPLFGIQPKPNVFDSDNQYSSDTDAHKTEAVECVSQQNKEIPSMADEPVHNKSRGNEFEAECSRSDFSASTHRMSFGDPKHKIASSKDDFVKDCTGDLSSGAEVARSSCPGTQGNTSKNQQLADVTNPLEDGSSTLEKSSSTLVESPLSSCTLVEGLLFPVEYYIRTTRRMSACQRQVDLEAVIHSQLGKSKKARRRKSRCSISGESKSDLDTSGKEESNFSQMLPVIVNEPLNSANPLQAGGDLSSLQVNENQQVVCITTSNTPSVKVNDGKETKRGRRRCSVKARRLSKSSTSYLQSSGDQVDNKEKKDSVDACCHPCDSQSEKENCVGEENVHLVVDQKRASSLSDSTVEVKCIESDCGTSSFTVCTRGNGTQALRGHGHILEHIQNSFNGSTDKRSRSCRDVLETRTVDFSSGSDASQTVCQTPVSLLTSPVIQDKQPDCKGVSLFCFSEGDAVVSPMHLRPKRPTKGLKNKALKKACFQNTKNVHSDTEDFCTEPIFEIQKFRFSVKNISCLDFIDFDLPDDEFEQLKLEKIKSCALRHFRSISTISPSEQTVNDADPRPHTRTELFTQNCATTQVNKCSQKSDSNSVNTEAALDLSSTMEKYLSETDLSHCKELSSGVLSTPMSAFSVDRSSLHNALNTSPFFPSLGFTPDHGISFSQQRFGALSDSTLECPSQSKSASPEVPKGNSTTKVNTCSTHGTPAASCDKNFSAHKPTWVEGEKERHLSVIKDEHAVQESGLFTGCRLSGGQSLFVTGFVKETKQENKVLHLKKCVHSTSANAETGEKNRLQLISKFKVDSSSVILDLNTVWWEFDGNRQLCIVTSSSSTISLWKPHMMDQWLEMHTWHFAEAPILQIISVPGITGLISVALGHLKFEEVRALVYSSEDMGFEQLLLVTGDITAVLGMAEARLVVCRGGHDSHQVELTFISSKGRVEGKRCLKPPDEAILAFSEVDGEKKALIGATTLNSIVIWNTETGQLLQTIDIGKYCPSSFCRAACSDSGIMFILLSLHCTEDDTPPGFPVFRLFAANPKTACCIPVMSYTLPTRCTGRYVTGDVKSSCAVALLTSGAIAIWDLSHENCTVWLPPYCEKDWSLVRWTNRETHLLAGQKDGNIFLYKYLGANRE